MWLCVLLILRLVLSNEPLLNSLIGQVVFWVCPRVKQRSACTAASWTITNHGKLQKDTKSAPESVIQSQLSLKLHQRPTVFVKSSKSCNHIVCTLYIIYILGSCTKKPEHMHIFSCLWQPWFRPIVQSDIICFKFFFWVLFIFALSLFLSLSPAALSLPQGKPHSGRLRSVGEKQKQNQWTQLPHLQANKVFQKVFTFCLTPPLCADLLSPWCQFNSFGVLGFLGVWFHSSAGTIYTCLITVTTHTSPVMSKKSSIICLNSLVECVCHWL